MRPNIQLLVLITVLVSGCLPVWSRQAAQSEVPAHPTAPRALIVNADDLGLSEGVTNGIVQAWREGVVTSTSALVNLEGAMERIVSAHQTNPRLPIGLHLNVTTGRPVLPPSQIPTLVDSKGYFYDRDALIERAPDISLAELKAELRAQGERLQAAGIRIDHLDYHEGILFLYSPFFQVVRELAREWAVPVRHPVPETLYGRVTFPGGGGNSGMIWKMIAFGILHPFRAWQMMPHMTPDAYKRQAALLAEERTPTPVSFLDGFFGVATVEGFVGMLPQLPPGINEVAVHPGLVDEPLRKWGGGYVQLREAELAVLLDPRLREALVRNQVELTTFSSLTSRPDVVSGRR